jgi:hypothetical protein
MEGNPRVWVRRADYERVREWLADYDARRGGELPTTG